MPVEITPATVPAQEAATFDTFWMPTLNGRQTDPNGPYNAQATVMRVAKKQDGTLVPPTLAQIAVAKEHGVKLQGVLRGDLYEIAARRAQAGKPALLQAVQALAMELCDEAVAQGIL